jgi:Tfp pilus assembly protein PilF
MLKDYEMAEEEIDISLKHRPYQPVANYEAAMLYLETGDREKGREYLQRAVDIWKDADPDYEKANLARAKLAEI